MSKFSRYAQKFDEQAKASFKAYLEAKSAYEKAEAKAGEYSGQVQRQQLHSGSSVDPKLSAMNARAQADLIEAKEAYEQAKRTFRDSGRQFDSLRKELAVDIEAVFCANPNEVENNTLELLKSGILTGKEYDRLMYSAQQSSNHTMVRIIGSYAGKAAQARGEQYGVHDKDAELLRYLADIARQEDGSEYLKAFDYMLDVYNRTTNNPSMINNWDQLVSKTVEAF